MASVLTPVLLRAVRERFALDWHGIHGAPHWARVRINALAIARHNGARTDVVELFAFLHDSCRMHDGQDRDHGLRAVEFARQLRGHAFVLDEAEFALLVHACATHSDGHMDGDPTVQACWDADRLDLWRVGVTPNLARLTTSVARSETVFSSARRRSLAWCALI